MEPVDPRVDPALLPEGAVAEILAKDHDTYKPLPVVTLPNQMLCITRWSLSKDERMAIVQGEDIYITLVASNGMINPLWASVGVDPLKWK